MMVQKLHWKGQPRPASKLLIAPAYLLTIASGKNGVG